MLHQSLWNSQTLGQFVERLYSCHPIHFNSCAGACSRVGFPHSHATSNITAEDIQDLHMQAISNPNNMVILGTGIFMELLIKLFKTAFSSHKASTTITVKFRDMNFSVKKDRKMTKLITKNGLDSARKINEVFFFFFFF